MTVTSPTEQEVKAKFWNFPAYVSYEYYLMEHGGKRNNLRKAHPPQNPKQPAGAFPSHSGVSLATMLNIFWPSERTMKTPFLLTLDRNPRKGQSHEGQDRQNC